MYLTRDELIAGVSSKILVQLTNDDPRATEINDSVLDMAIQTASERIDAALRSRYLLPLSQTPTLLGNHCLYLARYWLYSRRPETRPPENVSETYKQAIKELEQIATGKLHLGIAEIGADSSDDLLPDSGEYKVKAPTHLDTSGY